MSQQAFVFPELVGATNQRPARCPRCGKVGLRWHRRHQHSVVDLRGPQVAPSQHQCGGVASAIAVKAPRDQPE